MLTRRSLIASFLALPIFNWFKPKPQGEILDGGFRMKVLNGVPYVKTGHDVEIKNLCFTWKYLDEN